MSEEGEEKAKLEFGENSTKKQDISPSYLRHSKGCNMLAETNQPSKNRPFLSPIKQRQNFKDVHFYLWRVSSGRTAEGFYSYLRPNFNQFLTLTWGWDEGGDDSCYEREGPLLLMKKQVKWRLVPNVYKTWLIQEQNLSSHRCPCLWTSFSGVINHYIAFPVKKIKPFRTPNLPQAIDLSNSLLTQLS